MPVVTFFHRDWAEQKCYSYQDNQDVFCFGNHCDFCSFIVINDWRICEAFTSNFPLCFNPVIKMSMATNYRYEVERPGAKNLRKALKRQEERIKVCAWQEIKGLRWDMCNWINFAYFLLGNYVKIKSIVRFILQRKRWNLFPLFRSN